MNPYAVYQQQKASGWTRIDLLLAMYDGAIGRLERAAEALRRNDAETAQPLVDRAQLIVGELVNCLDLSYGEVPVNTLRLYEFVLHLLGQGGVDQIEAALKVLRNLREGFQGIRDQAVDLERSGQIPAFGEDSQTLQANA